jgi:hypothetical protein
MSITVSMTVVTRSNPEPRESSPRARITSLSPLILVLSSHLHSGVPSCLFPLGFPLAVSVTHLTMGFIVPVKAIRYDLITIFIFGKEYRPASYYFLPLGLKYPKLPLPFRFAFYCVCYLSYHAFRGPSQFFPVISSLLVYLARKNNETLDIVCTAHLMVPLIFVGQI